jgi:hypothetical protein
MTNGNSGDLSVSRNLHEEPAKLSEICTYSDSPMCLTKNNCLGVSTLRQLIVTRPWLVGWECLRVATRRHAASSRRRRGRRAGWPRDVDLKELDLPLLGVLEHLEVSCGELGDGFSILVVHEDVEWDETRREAECLTIWFLSPDRRRCI